jgi:hypothetical protein
MLKHLLCLLKRGFWIVPLAWVLVIHYVHVHFGERYTSDSYGLYLLGKNIFEGNGYFSPAIRDFYLDPNGPWLSRSFPPLYPFLVGLTDFFLNQGMAAGQVANLFIGLFLLYVWFIICKRISGYLFFVPFFIPIIYSSIGAQSLWVDAIAARTNTITFFIMMLVLNLLSDVSSTTNNKTYGWAGACLGLLTLARFDSMVFCFALPVIMFCFTKVSFKQMLLMFSTMLLVMLPWAIRNMIVFHTPFASDNTISVMSTYPRIVQLCFFEDRIPLITDNPSMWLHQHLNYLKSNIGTLFSTLSIANGKIVSFLYMAGLVFAFIYRKDNYPKWIFFIISFTWIVLHLFTVSLTSYGIDPRYYIISNFLILGGFSIFIISIINKIINLKFSISETSRDPNPRFKTIGFELMTLVGIVLITIHIYAKDLYLNKNDRWWPWTQHIENMPVKKGALVASKEAELISFYTGWNTIYIPENAFTLDNNYLAWLKHWKPSYLIIKLFDFNNPLAQYPYASVVQVMEPFVDNESSVLLKINWDVAALTKQDALDDAKARAIWQQKTLALIPPADQFFAINDNFYRNGIALQWAGFYVQNTPENQLKYVPNKFIVLPDGERRVILNVAFDRTFLRIQVMGDPFINKFSGPPDALHVVDQ